MLWCGDSRRLNVWIAHRYDREGGIKRERERASEREREREVRVCVWWGEEEKKGGRRRAAIVPSHEQSTGLRLIANVLQLLKLFLCQSYL